MALSAARNDNKAAVIEAVGRRAFPPRLVYPEEKVDDMQLSRLFSRPLFVWIPEYRGGKGLPSCINRDCNCNPKVKDYCRRVVESVECKCDLVFVKYRCAVTGSYFSTVSPDYFAQWPDMIFHFPFVLSQKLVFSNSLMEMVHDGITAQNGLQRTMVNIERRRKQRYYKLLGLFSSGIKRNHERCFTYLAPTPISEDQYADQNKVVDNHTLTTAWLHATELYGSLCEKVMKDCVVKRVMRMDHSVKFCKRLKLWKAKGQRESLKDAKMILLFQNEIGQIIGRRLTRSENKEETRALLQHVKSQFRLPSGDDVEHVVVSDNASAVKKMVSEVFGSEVVTKQDPFHVITRITEKIKVPVTSKRISKELSRAIYNVDRELRPTAEMALQFQSVVNGVLRSSISCSLKDWKGSCQSNLEQIQRGELYVSSNTYEEGGHRVRVVSTSQLEGFHSSLKKLLTRNVSIDVGLRILDWFIVKHNLSIGAKFGRNPPMKGVDLISAGHTALLCGTMVPTSPQMEYVMQLFSSPLVPPQYRTETERDFDFDSWAQVFQRAKVNTTCLEGNLNRSRQHRSTVAELLLKRAVTLQSAKLKRDEFFYSLRLASTECEGDQGFSAEEHELLRQLRCEQAASKREWCTCEMITTMMFNIVVCNNTNPKIRLQQRSYATMVSKIKSLGADPESTSSARKQAKLFNFAPQEAVSLALRSPIDCEADLMRDVFKILRKFKAGTARKQLFHRIYDFASCVCAGIGQLDESVREKRWEALKAAQNRKKRKLAMVTNPTDAPLSCPAPDEEEKRVESLSTLLVTDQETAANEGIDATTTTTSSTADDTPPARLQPLVSRRDTVGIDEDAGQSSVPAKRPRPSTIAPEHLAELRKLSDSLVCTRGKYILPSVRHGDVRRDAQRLLRVCGRLIEELFAAGSLDAIGQRFFWRELPCHRWSEGAASLALELLLLKAQLTCITRGEKVALTEADEILDVVAFAYAHLPVDLKECCIDQVSALISTFIHEGPTYQFTPRMVLQLRLLECLTSCHFLDESGGLDASAWLDEYFPACFDCCGVAIQLLNDHHQPGPSTSRANVSVGVIRMLDMCLLVIKAGFDFFKSRRKDIEDLARIISPVIAASLVHLASFSPACSPETSRGACPEAIQMRSVETSLHLLSKMASVVKESEYDALVGVFKLLLTPNMVSRIGCVRPSLVSACFDAIHQLVSHSKVAEVVGPPLATLLQANDISELYGGYKKTRQIRSTRDHDSGCSGCANSDRAGEGNFPGRTVATVLSGMDLDEPGMAVLEGHATALSLNQPSSAVLRPDAPQWFDDEDSGDNDSAPEQESSKASDRRVTTLQAEVAVPQWFDDEDYEEGRLQALRCHRRTAVNVRSWRSYWDLTTVPLK